jgi:hypothetical protein
MSSGDVALRAIIAQIEALPEALVEGAAPEIASELHAAITRQISAGTDPDGKPWDRTQQGAQPLVNAANALRVTAVGSTIVARLTGPEALHHRGAVKGGKVRQILPSNEIPDPVAKAIRVVLDRRFRGVTGG